MSKELAVLGLKTYLKENGWKVNKQDSNQGQYEDPNFFEKGEKSIKIDEGIASKPDDTITCRVNKDFVQVVNIVDITMKGSLLDLFIKI